MTGERSSAATPRRDQLILLAALLAIAALAWSYVIWLAAQMAEPSPATAMPDMPSMQMNVAGLSASAFTPWTPVHLLFIFAMWAVMMVGMMTPSVAPTILIYARVMQQATTSGRSAASAAWFTGGYFVAWSAFSVCASLAQWGLEALALVTPTMAGASHKFGGAVLIAAGAYQWLPIKNACLSQCRAPLSFLQRHGGLKAGAAPSLRLGFLHGWYCIGCCWALMALLFVVGVMNLLWIAALMIYVLVEKLIPGGHYFSHIAGVAAVVAGIWMLWA